MTKVSRSAKRHTFQKEKYIARQKEKGEKISEDYLDMFETFEQNHARRFDDPKNRENNLEYDLLTTDWILEKARKNDDYAQNLYAALCNSTWRSKKLWPTLKEQNWSCSWRYAGGIIADMQEKGDYVDWYCSGIRTAYIGEGEPPPNEGYYPGWVSEGYVTKEIEQDLDRLGWTLIEYDQREE